MSDERRAWSWRQAFCKSDLPATTKHVLQTLSMFMNSLGESCYPSIEDLMDYSGLSKRAVLNHIEVARDAGWISISQHGFRGQRWKRHEYTARWPERNLDAPSTSERMVKNAECEVEGGARDAPAPSKKVVHEVHKGGAPDAPKVVHDVHQDKTSPLNNPIPVQKRESAREPVHDKTDNSGSVSRETWLRRLKKVHSSWPTFASDSDNATEKAWFGLSEAERDQASKLASVFVAHCRKQEGRTKFRSFSVYLSEKLWLKLPRSASERSGEVIAAKAYGKLWGAARFADLLKPAYGTMPKPTPFIAAILQAGDEQAEQERKRRLAQFGWPRVTSMHQRAEHKRSGGTVSGELSGLADEFEAVKVGSDLWKAWQQLHVERGWPWFGPDRHLPDWVFMPALLPAEFPSLYGAVAAALESFEELHNRMIDAGKATQEAAE